ncbi:autotransporter outer membrane beta-barrel domain-containing protein [Brucella pituitosa]|uniref:autotransporter family protein n=1 Tax=Brucella pituitosa TaxID=571256 RepID=UPI0013747981|nr:autotransporter outer membrane beta-barrel domain-containing protein [Brucella pituitosa]
MPSVFAADESIDGGQTTNVPTDRSSPWFINGELAVGLNGSGTLNIADGIVWDLTGTIGSLAGSDGTVLVDGAASTWRNGISGTGDLYVGNQGAGKLTISNGGQVFSGQSYIGYDETGKGTVLVDGVGSTWTVHKELIVGEKGTGHLYIKDGGAVVSTADVVIGDKGVGVVTVDGDGSHLSAHQNLFVGYAGGSVGTLNITNGGTVSASGNTWIGALAGTSSGVIDVNGAGSTFNVDNRLLVGVNGSGTLTVSDAGNVQTKDMEIAVAPNSLGTVNIGGGDGEAAKAAGTLNTATIEFGEGKGYLNFNTTNEFKLAAAISGKGTINEIAGKTILTGENAGFTGATNVTGGTLAQGAAGSFSGGSDYFVGTAGTLDLGGFETTVASLSNGGTVMFGGAGGTVLRVAGDYTANSGTLIMNTVLGGDDSKTDMLQVDGNSSGSGAIYLQNQGGTGAQTVNGIKIVNVDGSSNGKFTLANSYRTKDGQQAVVGGAYAYTLQQGGDKTPTDGDWYLVNHMTNPDNPVDPDCAQTNSCPPVPPAPRYSAGAPVYEGYVQNMQVLNKLPSLQQRVGNRSLSGSNGSEADHGASVNEYGLWGRIAGGHNRLEPSTSTARMKQDINTLQMQAGVDGQFYENDKGRLIAGMTGQYGHARGDVSSLYGDGSISTDAWSLGATATWYGNDGFYVDAQGQVTWFSNDLDSWTANQGLAHGRKATGYALSVETGKRMAIGGNWSLTPQAQLAWSSIHADAFRDVWDARVSVDDGSSLLGRLGLAAEYGTEWKDESGHTTHANVYGLANVYQELMSGTRIDLAGVDFDTDDDRTWAGIGAGGTLAWADNKYALYGEGSVNTGLDHFAQSYSLKGNVGFKVKW